MGRRTGEKEFMIKTAYMIKFHVYKIIHTHIQTHIHSCVCASEKEIHEIITKMIKVIILV